jgi:hypothetical protein
VTDFVVGPGVQQAIAEAGDEARSDEQFVILREGDKVSQTFGSLGIYWWYESENAVKRLPF